MHRIKHIGWLLAVALLSQMTASAAVSVYLSPEQLTARAPLVVEARVVGSRAGLDPATGALNTYITLDVDQVHRGPRELGEIVVREPGGAWGDVVHEVDAVPVYRAGARVLAYLEPSADGSLRTVGMFFGKFDIEETADRAPLQARRDLEGQGTILGRADHSESLSRDDLVALVASVRYRSGRSDARSSRQPAWRSHPPEWDGLHWDAASVDTATPGDDAGGAVTPALKPRLTSSMRFAPLSTGNPTRWAQTDSGVAVSIHVQPNGNPLNDDQAAVNEIGRALDAWTEVSSSRLQLSLGNPNYNYTAAYASPASNYTGINIVLFDDPYDDISDPTGCGGVLAIGGYWRSGSSGAPVNGVTFHPAMQQYVIFNNSFECFLGTPDNLAEVAAHEIGHGIGFGHSAVSDSLMRASAYGSRGPRLGNDDIDAAHCHYPHALTLVSPDGGETLTPGALETIAWASTDEAGGDPGTVDLEYSVDGGAIWKPIATGTTHDGSHGWLVPDDPSADVRVRVMRPVLGAMPAPYPSDACSADGSNGPLTIVAAPPLAGALGDGLRLTKNANAVRLTWGTSCSAGADDYAVYEGSLTALRSGAWDIVPATCSAGTDRVEELVPASGPRYYLVAPSAGAFEGDFAPGGPGQIRPQSGAACAPRETAACEP